MTYFYAVCKFRHVQVSSHFPVDITVIIYLAKSHYQVVSQRQQMQSASNWKVYG